MPKCQICKRDLQRYCLSSFSVPQDDKQRERWSQICGIKLSRTSRICIDHFPVTSIITIGKRFQLMPYAEPIHTENCLQEFSAEQSNNNQNQHNSVDRENLLQELNNDEANTTVYMQECHGDTEILKEQLTESNDPPTEFKCGEIFCSNFTDLRISCDFCNSKQFSFEDFLLHLHNEHFQNNQLKTEPLDCIKTENLEVEILQNEDEVGEGKDGWLESFEEIHTMVEKDDISYISEENEIVEDGEDEFDNGLHQPEENVEHVDDEMENKDDVDDEMENEDDVDENDNSEEEVDENEVCDTEKKNEHIEKQQDLIIEKIEPYSFEDNQSTENESNKDNDEMDEEVLSNPPDDDDEEYKEKTVKSLKKRKSSLVKKALLEFQCPECPQQFMLKKLMDNHVFENHGGYKCSKCDKRCRLRQHLIRHEERHNVRQHPCIHCNKVFADIGYWKRHIEEHMLELKIVCPHENCGKRFPSELRLKIHSRVHTEGYNSYKKSNNIYNNQGSRLNYVCDMCGYSCGAMITLQIHQRSIHTGEKPFSCEVCGNRFVSQYALKNHAIIHSDERNFKCDICEASFKSNKILSRHKFIHSEERKFKCNYCGKAFKQPHCRDAHVKHVHKGIKHIRAKRKRKPKVENAKIDIEILNIDS